MAEGNLVTVADRILQLLASSVMKETALLWPGAGDDFNLLRTEIMRIRPLCEGADKKMGESESLFERLETALYHTDDLLDEIFTVALQRRNNNKMAKRVRTFFSTSNPLVFQRKMCWEIKKVRETIIKISKEVEVKTQAEGRSLISEEEVIIGRDTDKEKIIAQFLKGNLEENPLVIPIVGIGGLGKTALARGIFNDEKVQRHFDLRIWVCLTRIVDVRVIVKKIIASIPSQNPGHPDIDHLHQQIGEKRYLLVLDDVWNQVLFRWLELRDLLSVGANGSTIIITTRSKEVAEITGEKQYDLSSLNEDNSWSLFLNVAFKQRQQPTDTETIKIGKEAVKKFLGTPLAIKTVGSLFVSRKLRITDWASFYDKASKILADEIGHSDRIAENVTKVLAALWSSYDSLSSPLKDCFAYCGLFPIDSGIDVKTLTTLWMSEGFIESNSNPEDLGYDYIMQLVEKKFFQEIKKDEWGNITKCKLHNLLHGFARAVAGNGFATLDLKGRSFDRLLRHLSFDFHVDSSRHISNSSAKLERIRSIILPRQFQWTIEGKSTDLVCDGFIRFKFLRTLDLHNSGTEFLPNSIGDLKHLRYLDLSQNLNIKVLPNSMSKLQNLQTLKLNHCSDLQTLPKDFKKLVSLRNLENESCYCLTHMPRGLGQLVNIRTLSEFVLSKGIGSISNESGRLDELKELNHLSGKLKIKNLRCREGDKTAEANLYKKENLLSLVLIWDIGVAADQDDCEKSLEDLRPHQNLRELSISGYGGVKFASTSWLPLHKNLVKFSLSGCTRFQFLPQLDHLPSLEVLIMDKLTELEYISDKLFRMESFFPSLRVLRLTNLPKLKGWWKAAPDNVEEEIIFPCLSKLIVEDCPTLTSMPLFPCLEELLVLKNTSWEPFKRTVSSTSSTVSPLCGLRTLSIIQMSNGESNMMWKSLCSLCSLTFDHLHDIDSLLEGLQVVTNLQELNIWRCDSLEEIPHWIGNIKSLKTISIKLCPNFTLSRDRMSFISSLGKVEIKDCPKASYIESMLKDRLYS